ncbi:hypothetical protein [Acinetobacter schindleri]|uniref:hypothetical protein n=1 Tax=Acinetobacter schindleri TaxID=108981 RepID=UPI002FDEAB23
MAKQYRALKPVGRWSKGQMIGELPSSMIQKLLADDVIEVIKPEAKPKAAKKEVTPNG